MNNFKSCICLRGVTLKAAWSGDLTFAEPCGEYSVVAPEIRDKRWGFPVNRWELRSEGELNPKRGE